MLDIPEDVQLEHQELELTPEIPAGNGEVPGVGDAEQLQLQVPQEGEIVIGEVLPHQIEVDGNVLTVASSLATLRAACGFYGVTRSGSNAKCYRTLCQHQKTLELLSAQAAIAQTQGVVERHPNANFGEASRPETAGVARADPYPLRTLVRSMFETSSTTGSTLTNWRNSQHKHPHHLYGFLYGEEEEGWLGPTTRESTKGALWLVLTCSQTGYFGVVPIQGKGQIIYMTHEVLSFVQSLGYVEVGFYGDNEPTIRQILKIIITLRHALGLKTRPR